MCSATQQAMCRVIAIRLIFKYQYALKEVRKFDEDEKRSAGSSVGRTATPTYNDNATTTQSHIIRLRK